MPMRPVYAKIIIFFSGLCRNFRNTGILWIFLRKDYRELNLSNICYKAQKIILYLVTIIE